MSLIKILPLLSTAASAFLLGGIWYSEKVFGRIWAKEEKFTKGFLYRKGHSPWVFLLSFILSFIIVTALSVTIGSKSTISHSTGFGFGTGLLFVATSFGINYLFAGRSLKLYLIDSGYHVAQFTLYGFLLGLWNYY